MKSIGDAVEQKLVAQREGDDAVELWKKLWTLHEQGGSQAVEAYLRHLLEAPDADAGVAPEGA